MARLPYVDPEDPAVGGVNVNLIKAMANHPALLQGFMAFAGAVYGERSITPAQRELAYLAATVVNRCHY